MFSMMIAWTPLLTAASFEGMEADIKLAGAALLGIAVIICGVGIIIRMVR